MKTISGLAGKDLRVHMVIGAFLVAVALGVEIVPELTASPEVSRGIAFAGVLPARPMALRLQSSAARPVGSSSAREEVKGPMSLDEFLGALETGAPALVASKFTKAFLKEPVLRKALVDFRKEKGGDAPAVEFMERVGRLAEFRKVMSQFRGESGSQQAFLQLSKNPEIGAVLKGMTASLKGAGASAVGGADKFAALRRSSSLSSSNSLASSLPAGASFRSTRGAGLLASAASVGATGSSRIGAGAAGTDGGGTGAGSGFNASNATGSGEQGGENLPQLAAPSSVDKNRNAGSYLASIFASAPKALRDALMHQCDANNICDPVAACEAAGLYDQCKAFCDATPSCSGMLPPQTTQTASTGNTGNGSGTGPGTGGSDTPTILRGGDGGQTVTIIMPPNPGICATGAAGSGAEAWQHGGELVGGAVGTIGGAMIGTAIGGPVGGIIGGAVGGLVGTVVGGAVGGFLHGIFG